MAKKMAVLIACEESQAISTEFRELGHEAYSCDIQDCSGGHPEWHIKGDVLGILEPVDMLFGGTPCAKGTEKAKSPDVRKMISFKTMDGKSHYVEGGWDLIIAHPPCTFLSNAGARWLYAGGKLNQERYQKGLDGKSFFMTFLNCSCRNVVIENPIPSSVYKLPKYTQIIQPYQFGEPWSKKTCLWIRGDLPLLEETNVLTDYKPYVSSGSYTKTHDPRYKGKSRSGGSAKIRSKTFPGIAKAMAEQWGGLVG